jgi:hypothetical protein
MLLSHFSTWTIENVCWTNAAILWDGGYSKGRPNMEGIGQWKETNSFLYRKLPVQLSLSQTSKNVMFFFFSFMFVFYKIRGQEDRTGVLPWFGGIGTCGGGGCGEMGRRMNMVHMYVNAKMIPVETVSGIRGGGMNESNGGGNSRMI